ncbi:putative defense protein 3 [Corticium candelabrum]|uniref:putative defense protein 3 n=1 Tax=Corticium candelabrum TaxID=121492 RepID=UPI002E265CAC|nr:putative defense protein 3 [Corticium candelabrum]
MALSLCVLSLLFLFDGVHGYSSGPPDNVCVSMAPSTIAAPNGHGAAPQTGPSPFNVTHNVENGTAYTGQRYQIEITSSASSSFKGFMCQVRNISDNTDTKAWGEFEDFPTPKAKNLACTSPKGAVVHNNPTAVNSLRATWTAPSTVADSTFQLYCTVVQERVTYWVKLEATSDPFRLVAAPTTPVATTEAPTTGNVTRTTGDATPTTPIQATPKSGSTSNVACTLLVIMTLLFCMLRI